MCFLQHTEGFWKVLLSFTIQRRMQTQTYFKVIMQSRSLVFVLKEKAQAEIITMAQPELMSGAKDFLVSSPSLK